MIVEATTELPQSPHNPQHDCFQTLITQVKSTKTNRFVVYIYLVLRIRVAFFLLIFFWFSFSEFCFFLAIIPVYWLRACTQGGTISERDLAGGQIPSSTTVAVISVYPIYAICVNQTSHSSRITVAWRNSEQPTTESLSYLPNAKRNIRMYILVQYVVLIEAYFFCRIRPPYRRWGLLRRSVALSWPPLCSREVSGAEKQNEMTSLAVQKHPRIIRSKTGGSNICAPNLDPFGGMDGRVYPGLVIAFARISVEWFQR